MLTEGNAASLTGDGLVVIGSGLRYIGAGIAAVALVGPGIGIGILFSHFITAVARNPATEKTLFPLTMLGFALTEAIGLFALLVVFLILFV